ncbi:uncharacterized protein I303_105017 [Kwoniella dejecticola CBS 10117]|uniref:Uncharacterized protein n=1 Tax=Kwoniella dejecticola CBS 10117 TaxID=1296121 RepID=A0A1A6A3P6_9TREE|nr:uncharacterized protein I303_05537 [Kwoniella dejecticola CBS 10117]OBR84678.1 hypothetical protein I303_05537 [Kwoniella dejecticola CBS 10117]
MSTTATSGSGQTKTAILAPSRQSDLNAFSKHMRFLPTADAQRRLRLVERRTDVFNETARTQLTDKLNAWEELGTEVLADLQKSLPKNEEESQDWQEPSDGILHDDNPFIRVWGDYSLSEKGRTFIQTRDDCLESLLEATGQIPIERSADLRPQWQ